METDASTIPTWEYRPPYPYDNQGTQTEIVMAEKGDTDLT